ncbi:MAG TPA: glycosyltransferase [Marinobacter sp.]|uniref:Glycosyltransferase subfamily 4-like N-terminal domain-containing protein n=1 Tax=marine sediment metagenome TaxID=412755 RepID=A0A0F9QVH5_9ZZZZ|nr:glycosyltransferase [Marinobacter sp.]
MSAPDCLTVVQLIATPGGNWGGMEKHTADLSAELVRRGHKVHVLAHPEYQNRFSNTIHFHPLPVQWGRRNPLLKWRLRKILRELSPNVLHAQGNKAAAMLSGEGKPGSVTLGTLHGTKSSHKDFDKLDGVIAVSKGIQQALTHPDTKLIHNGIRPHGNSVITTHRIPESQDFALAIGRLEPVKQFDNLIAAWATLKPQLPLYILGNGSEADALRSQIERLNARGFIKLPGHEDNPAAWLQHASVCVISSGREGFPYTLVEALLARCPVLSTPVNGALDLLPADSLAASTDPGALQTLLSERLADLEGLKNSQNVCFERASQELTLEAMTNLTADFYYQLLRKKTAN